MSQENSTPEELNKLHEEALELKESFFNCPTGKFTVEYLSGLNNGDGQIINDIIFEQIRDIEGKPLDKFVRISLKNYLPDNWVFKQSTKFGADRKRREVCFPKGGLELDKSLTVLLHEIGHAQTYEYHRVRGTYEKYMKPDNSFLRERDAWARTLRIIRTMVKNGIIAEKAWQSRKDILNLIYTALSSGDRGFDKRFIEGQTFEKVDLSDIEAVDDIEMNKRIEELFKEIQKMREGRERRKREFGY